MLKFYNWYETNNHLWLIVEYCTGSDLLSIVKGDKVWPGVGVWGCAGEGAQCQSWGMWS